MGVRIKRNVSAGMALLIAFALMETTYITYGETEKAVITRIPKRFNRTGSLPEVEFQTPDGKMHKEYLMADFFTLHTEKVGDEITVEYLPFYPRYVRPAGISWAVWMFIVIFGVGGIVYSFPRPGEE